MPHMRGLTVIAASGDAARFAGAVEMAASWAALGGDATLFCRGDAVTRLADAMLADAIDGGVAVIACQSAMAEHGVDLAAHDARIAAGGMIGVLAALGDGRLVTT